MEELNQDKTQNNDIAAPAPVERPPISDMMLPKDQLPLIKLKDDLPGEPARVTEINDDGDDSMHGGYASVNGTLVNKHENRFVWIVIIVMTIMCIAVGICSSVITARLVQKGIKPDVIKTNGELQQNIAAVVAARKSSITEVRCGNLTSSGIVMKRDGKKAIVLTNAHAVAQYIGGSIKPRVRFAGYDYYFESDVLGYDGHYDVAVLSVEVEDELVIYDIDGSYVLSPDVSFAEGDYVVSIGNAMSMGISAYDGIISRKSELLECDELFGGGAKKTVPVFRTTAVINAGMSGGGVFDMKGRLVGLGTYRMSNTGGVDTDGGSASDVEDTGFATPMSIVYPIYKRILNSDGGEVGLFAVDTQKTNSAIGRIVLSQLGFSAEYEKGKLTVRTVSSGSNIHTGDVITKIGDIAVTTDICDVAGAFLRYHRSGSGKTLKITVLRGDTSVTATFDGFRYAI